MKNIFKSKLSKLAILSLLSFSLVNTTIAPMINSSSVGIQEVSAATKKHKYVEGVNKRVKVNWHTDRIYMSKRTVKNIGIGATVAGIWIPGVAVSGMLATAGVGIMEVPGGIYFEYDRLFSGFGGGFGRVRFQ